MVRSQRAHTTSLSRPHARTVSVSVVLEINANTAQRLITSTRVPLEKLSVARVFQEKVEGADGLLYGWNGEPTSVEAEAAEYAEFGRGDMCNMFKDGNNWKCGSCGSSTSIPPAVTVCSDYHDLNGVTQGSNQASCVAAGCEFVYEKTELFLIDTRDELGRAVWPSCSGPL